MFNEIEHSKGTGTTNFRLLGRGQMSDFQDSHTVMESLKLPGVDIDYSLESIRYAVIWQRGNCLLACQASFMRRQEWPHCKTVSTFLLYGLTI